VGVPEILISWVYVRKSLNIFIWRAALSTKTKLLVFAGKRTWNIYQSIKSTTLFRVRGLQKGIFRVAMVYYVFRFNSLIIKHNKHTWLLSCWVIKHFFYLYAKFLLWSQKLCYFVIFDHISTADACTRMYLFLTWPFRQLYHNASRLNMASLLAENGH
jgi:hypothetical protein